METGGAAVLVIGQPLAESTDLFPIAERWLGSGSQLRARRRDDEPEGCL